MLAFWVGSVTTNASGEASVDVKLPESLTTYRIMAVAGDRVSRFGNGDAEVRVNKPLTMKPTFPRFLAVGDKALFGAVVTSQLREAGDADGDDSQPRSRAARARRSGGADAERERRRIGRSPLRGGRPRRSAARACR